MLIATETNLVNAIKTLKKQGLWIVAADMDGEQDYFRCQLPSPTALVVGGEGQGIRRLVKENCDMVVRIPMGGTIQSLNASVAAGLIIYEVLRQRQTVTS
jgi:23S rRNA (guanosine2251-2'-O)-methyltransferase